MLRALAVLAAAALAVGDQTSFDCPMRALAVEFAAAANPKLSAAQLQGVADALNGAPEKAAGCNVTVPAALAAARERPALAGPPLPAPAAVPTFYVDYAAGNDNAAGSQAAPFKTVARGLVATRAAGSPATLVLRAGTHFLANTITLDARDAGLTVQSFPGEAAWLSRGTPLTGLKWTAYNISGGGWQVQQGENAVWGLGPHVWLYGQTNDYPTCEAACKANASCTTWTWHDTTVEPEYRLDCFFRNDGVYAPTAEAGHVSGYLAVGPNIWVADLSAFALDAVHGLRAPDGSRLIRARYPNADPELGFGSNLRADSWTAPQATHPVQPAVQYRPDSPARDSSYSFIYYQGGYGGICSVPGFGFTETAGTAYWCGNQTEGGGAFTWRTPYGMTVSASTLPHMPYANPAGAVVQAWHPARWASRMYLLDAASYAWNAATQVANISFAAGGFQDARGSDDAGNFYIENVMEELDAPGEWYFDEAAQKLYLFWNATSGTPPPADGSLVAVAAGATGLVNVTGSQAAPVPGLTFAGLGFRDTAYVYFAPHSIPSGGDWALSRTAALQLEGTVGAVVDGCLFERLDGTALMLSGYNRLAQVTNNDFKWIGGSAMVAWGRTTGDPTGTEGPDGTAGDQPRYSLIAHNVGHEVGIWEKQSSLLMQAKTSDSLVLGNIGYNGPRAGINQNDGFGGNNSFVRNLVFNQCRESGDHGPFNSWDRQVYLTYKGNGSTGFFSDWNYLSQNFLLSNYESQEGIDNDDGSAYYESSKNFLVYSGNGMKSDFGGHDNWHHDNVYAFIGRGFGICPQNAGHADRFNNNHVIQNSDGDYGGGQNCGNVSAGVGTVVHNNAIYTPTGAVTECGMSLAAWQAKDPANDPGTNSSAHPADAVILALARTALGI